MHVLVVILHTLACFGLILIVLLQRGKGADLGAAFGGSSQTVFGGQGAGGFLTKVTTIIATVFMLTSLSLAYMASHRVQATIMEDAGRAGTVTEQALPGEAPPAGEQAKPEAGGGEAAAPEGGSSPAQVPGPAGGTPVEGGTQQ